MSRKLSVKKSDRKIKNPVRQKLFKKDLNLLRQVLMNIKLCQKKVAYNVQSICEGMD